PATARPTNASPDAHSATGPVREAARRDKQRGVVVKYAVVVEVQLRAGVADPQGATIERALPHLGFDGVSDVRVGKCIRFTIEAEDEASARREIDELCARFLANPVIERTEVRIDDLVRQ